MVAHGKQNSKKHSVEGGYAKILISIGTLELLGNLLYHHSYEKKNAHLDAKLTDTTKGAPLFVS